MTTGEAIVNVSSTLDTGTRGTVFVLFGGEIGAMVMDMRWGIMLLVILIIADFRFGWGESSKRYKKALAEHDELHAEVYRWHTSRAVRRTLNKLADYIVVMLMCGAVGMAIFEPIGIKHTWGAWIGAMIACGCEIVSISGHFFYLHGIRVEKKSIGGFVRALVVAFAKKKDEDVGESIEEALERVEKENEEDDEK